MEFRKTPSPTLHIPRVGLVSRVRRLKPATELLQESQRYRSGHSIYATRIMQRYLPAKAPGQGPAGWSLGQDKENVAGTSYVHAMVQRLSRDSTPAKSGGSSHSGSSLSLHRPDSPARTQADLVAHAVHKLSTPSRDGAGRKAAPFKDLTNESRAKQPSDRESGGQTLSELDLVAEDAALRSQTVPQTALSLPNGTEGEGEAAAGQASHASMPFLAFEPRQQTEDGARERAATYCVSEGDRAHHQQPHSSHNGSESIEHISEEFLDPALLSIREGKGQKISPSSSTNSKNALCCQSSACSRTKPPSTSSSSQPVKADKVPSSPKSRERKTGRRKMGTIGVLCKQSMSFDLGVSLRAQSPEAVIRRPLSAESLGPTAEAGATSGKKVKGRPASTSSEGEAAVSPTTGEDKKKLRSRFLDTSWLQKPKKFFKVSK